MGPLRRLAAPFVALLAFVVTGEVTDLVPCVDADCGVWSLVFGDSAPGGDGGPAGSPEAACICHAQFVTALAVPGVPVPGDVAQGLSSAVNGRPAARVADVPHPPPLG